MRFLLILLCVIAASTITSCHYFHGERVHGDGNVISQNRAITDFNKVDVSSAIELYITQDANYAVKVETDNNLQPYVEIYKEGDVLHVHQKNNISLDPTGSLKVYVSMPTLRELEVSGACEVKGLSKITSTEAIDINVSGASRITLDITAPDIELDLTGASSAELRGQTKDLSIDGSGSSDIRAFELLSENTRVSMSGAGHADVYASVKLDAHASGASEIIYKGNGSMSANTSGASSVKKQ